MQAVPLTLDSRANMTRLVPLSRESRFDSSRQAKEARRKEADLKKTQNQMLKTIGQLTLERDFLQGCFRKAGYPIPKLPSEDQ